MKKPYLIAITAGVLCGLLTRGIFEVGILRSLLQIMSFGFLFLGPLVIGMATISAYRGEALSKWKSFLLPALPILVGSLVTLALGWEGFICIVMYLPLGILLAGIGGLIQRSMKDKSRPMVLMGFLFLPVVSSNIERQIPAPEKNHEVQNEILIKAPAEKIWHEIKSVPSISKSEMPSSWVHRMGFPRPLEAVIDREEAGGVRLAKFEGDLTFHETVQVWKPNEELSFKIEIDPNTIPPTTLDQHVTIGGPYFDVLYGSYTIKSVSPEMTRLILKSQFRISTHFNFYASLWTSLIMDQIQSDILNVIKLRAEISHLKN